MSSYELSRDHCIQVVKQNDFDSYLAGLLVPRIYRDAYFCIRAFNVEMAMIKDHAQRNNITGRIRFQWWRNTLEEIYFGNGVNAVNDQPLINALSFHIKEKNLTLRWFERTLEARLICKYLIHSKIIISYNIHF
jgi:phytoene/squalene synthetase